MSTAAEIAAGRAFYELKMGPYGSRNRPWESIEHEDERAAWIKDGMTVVHAYQREAWREPTAEDIRDRKPLLVTNSYMRRQDEWSSWRGPTIGEWFNPSNEFDAVRVQDLPPLPEPRP